MAIEIEPAEHSRRETVRISISGEEVDTRTQSVILHNNSSGEHKFSPKHGLTIEVQGNTLPTGPYNVIGRDINGEDTFKVPFGYIANPD